MGKFWSVEHSPAQAALRLFDGSNPNSKRSLTQL
jgi:hypothetical protein